MPLLTGALALLCVIGPLSTDMYLPAFPRMAQELGTDASGVQLTLTAFLVGMTLGHLVFGPLSDRFGRRGPLLAGAVACTAATALCALAPTLEWLVALRFAAGFGGAAGIVVGRAVVTDVTDGARAARLLGLLVTLGGIAPVVAPVAGGAVIEAAGWRSVFWVLAAVSAVVTAGVVVGVPESLPEQRRVAGGLAPFVRSVRTTVADGPYLGYSGAFTFGFGTLFCYVAGSPFLFQSVLGMGVGASSVAFSSGAVVTTLAALLSARLVGRVGAVGLLRTGLRLMLAGSCGLLLAAGAGALSLHLALPLLALVCAGLGCTASNSAALALARVPAASGTASALLGTAQSALGALVAPLMGLAGADAVGPLVLGMTLCSAAALVSARYAASRAARSAATPVPAR